MWSPNRAAFRAGRVQGTQWDNLGRYSFATGIDNIASAEGSVAMGGNNVASGQYSVAIGSFASATNYNAVAIGQHAEATGHSSYALGQGAQATGQGALALGYWVNSTHTASLVIGLAQTLDGLSSTANSQFSVHAPGGYRFFSNLAMTSGVTLNAGGGAWSTVSDRNTKQSFRDIDGEAVLSRIRAMSIPEWSYIAQGDSIRHVGPMAQDFFAAFGLGGDSLSITTSDISGINLLAIQSLLRRADALRVENDDLRAGLAETREGLNAARNENAALRNAQSEMLARLNALEALLRATATAPNGSAAGALPR